MVKPKTESTAINDLINLVATQAPAVQTDDLMFREPDPAPSMGRKRSPAGTRPNLARTTGLGRGPEPASVAAGSMLRGSVPAIPQSRPSLPPVLARTASEQAITPPPRTTTSQAALPLPALPRVKTSQAAMTPPPLPRTTTSQAAITPPVLPRTTTSQAAMTPPP
ncbi:MAG: hypothetical protein SFX73_08295, partial [Kofleriaceae bacterium]|nr:hypothetical protein [Kofleriaceae bacterium]